MQRRLWALLSALVLSACGGDSSDGAAAAAPTTGKVELRFSLSDKVRSEITDPAKGFVYGDLYLREDVTLGGPRKEAVAAASVKVEIDLVTGTVSAASFSVANLPANQYGFLGFLDVDGNATAMPGPDKGDPVTLPTNAIFFEIKAGETTQATIPFELTYGG